MRFLRATIWAALAASACLLASCQFGGPSVYQRLQDDDPKVRLNAILEAGNTHDRKALPLLVERLGDSDEDVRLLAMLALQKITGQRLGYQSYDPAPLRQEAIARWRQYLLTGKVPQPRSDSAPVVSATEAATTPAPATRSSS